MADVDPKPSQGKWVALSLVLLVVGFGGGYLASRASLQPGAGPAASPQPAPEAPPAPAPPPSTVASPAPAGHADAVTREGDEVVISEEYKNRLLTVDFAQLLHDANVRRYYRDGELRGVRINKIHAGSIYDKIGLENDDIIEAINGIALADTGGSQADTQAMLAKLPRVGAVELKVVRSHETLVLKLRIAGAAPP